MYIVIVFENLKICAFSNDMNLDRNSKNNYSSVKNYLMKCRGAWWEEDIYQSISNELQFP